MTDYPDSPIGDYLAGLPIYRRYAKGITAAAAAAINLAWLATMLPSGAVPTGVAVGVGIAIQVIGGVGAVVAIPNATTAAQLAQIERYTRGRHRLDP